MHSSSFLPFLVPYSFSCLWSSCLFLLHWCVSCRGCSPFQCVPALAWVTRGLNSPQMHTSSCTSFSVSSRASSCLSPRDILRVSFCVSSHATYSYISSHVFLCACSGYHHSLNAFLQRCQGLFWLVPVLVHDGSVLSIAESAGTIRVQHRAAPDLLPCSSLLPKFCWICPVQAMNLAATYFHFFLRKSYKKRKAWIFSYFYFKFCFFRLSENMIIISVCISTCNEWSDLL